MEHDILSSLLPPPQGYADWLTELKNRIHNAQQRATLAVNRELVLLDRLPGPVTVQQAVGKLPS